MSGTKVILDSNTIIFASKELIDVDKMLSRYDEFYASIITYAEVYAFDFQNSAEKDIIDEIFANLEIIELNKTVADQAIIYRKNKIKKIKLPDAGNPCLRQICQRRTTNRRLGRFSKHRLQRYCKRPCRFESLRKSLRPKRHLKCGGNVYLTFKNLVSGNPLRSNFPIITDYHPVFILHY